MKSIVKITLLVAMAGLGLVLSEGCKTTDEADKAEVNPAFAEAPPLAQEVNIQILERPVRGKNVLFTAVFPQGAVEGPFHAIMVGDEKIVLRDDGKNGDQTAGDGVFSVLLEENLDELTQELAREAREIESLVRDKVELLRFVGRKAEAVQLDEQLFALIQGQALPKDVRLPLDFIDSRIRPANPRLKSHSLMITDLRVVEDPNRTFNPCDGNGNPNGVWTFAHLMREMANSAISVEDFTRNWLAEWLEDLRVNNDLIPARTDLLNRVITPWIRRSGGTGPITLANWRSQPLDVTQAPFKLTAIVNRMDLGGNSGYSVSNAGEGRFVFCVVSCGSEGSSTALPFNIIFEYGLPLNNCSTIKRYAQDWIDLADLEVGSVAYNAALESITAVFTGAGANPAAVNGSALNQLRTNEINIGSPWELREFVLSGASLSLASATVKQEPARRYNRVSDPGTTADHGLLAAWVNSNQAAVESAFHEVPEVLSTGQPFLGGKAHTPTPGHFWDAQTTPGPNRIASDQARHMFSLTTCSGCHGGEANTALGGFLGDVPGSGTHPPFVHIGFVPFGRQATLSGFLIGDPSRADGLFRVNDPALRGGPRGFNDLERRARRLEVIAARRCFLIAKTPLVFELAQVIRFSPIARMEH